MEGFLTAAFLGFVEGLTEFIPVSSTAHLIILTEGLGLPAPPGHVFEVFIQLGAILAVMVLYRQKLWNTAIGLARGEDKALRFTINLGLGTLPALIAGALLHGWIKTNLYDPIVIAVMLIVGGLLIFFLERRFTAAHNHREIDDIQPRTAFLIGCAQMLALVPGVSRSGATIMGSLALGLTRPAAAEFSFFLSIPVMFAAVAYDLLRNWDSIRAYGHFDLMLVGLAAAFVTAMAVVRTVIGFIGRYGFTPFAWYRLAAGMILLMVFL